MGLEFGWFFSCDGDAAHIGTKFAEFPPSHETFTRIAQNAEPSGFSTILLPTSQASGQFGPQAPVWDSIVNAAVVAPATTSIKLLLAVRLGNLDPPYCARQLASLDELSGGRILLNVVTGGSPLTSYGEDMDHDSRYRRTEEYLQILDGLWTQDNFTFEGNFYRLKGATVYPKPVQKPRIPFYMAGSSEIARDIAVRHADYSVFWGETPRQVAEQVRDMDQRLAGTGKTLKYVTRFQIFARETEKEAVEAVREVLSRVDPEALDHRKSNFKNYDAFGAENWDKRSQGEMLEPNLWAGMKWIRSGKAVTILGSYEQCAKKIFEIEQAGIDLLILSGYPLHSECERVGQHVIPLVREMEQEHAA